MLTFTLYLKRKFFLQLSMLFLESKLEYKFSVFNKQHINEVWHYKFSIYYKFVMSLIWSINNQNVTEEL